MTSRACKIKQVFFHSRRTSGDDFIIGGYMKYAILGFLFLAACTQSSNEVAPTEAASCRGVFYDRNTYGMLRKFNEYGQPGRCKLDTVALTQWEQSSEDRRYYNRKCAPQTYTATMEAEGNYYAYRNGREALDFDGPSGTYRRIILGEGKDGQPTFTREEGCFYVRDGVGVDAGFGRQLLLDTQGVASTEPFVPTEIYKIEQSGSSTLMTRNDDTIDWDHAFCPDLRTPWEFCTELRNGNMMFFPAVTLAIQNSLRNEALMIRTKFSYEARSKAWFGQKWSDLASSRVESISSNWQYAVHHIVDSPRYIDTAWREYVMGKRPYMPDTMSPNSTPVCYASRKRVTLNDGGTAFVNGETCYIGGEYVWTQN